MIHDKGRRRIGTSFEQDATYICELQSGKIRLFLLIQHVVYKRVESFAGISSCFDNVEQLAVEFLYVGANRLRFWDIVAKKPL